MSYRIFRWKSFHRRLENFKLKNMSMLILSSKILLMVFAFRFYQSGIEVNYFNVSVQLKIFIKNFHLPFSLGKAFVFIRSYLNHFFNCFRILSKLKQYIDLSYNFFIVNINFCSNLPCNNNKHFVSINTWMYRSFLLY